MTGPPETEEEALRRLWKNYQEKERKRHQANPLLYYSYKILGNTPAYEKSFEEAKEDAADIIEYRNERSDKLVKEIEEKNREGMIRRRKLEPPGGMTRTQFLKEERAKRRRKKEELKQESADSLLCSNSRTRMFANMLNEVCICCVNVKQIR
jgi:hypothetical protein